ncbi:50S ribosomal protein L11 methyltransferase [Parasphingorhabdus sp.]|jgi:ribosomal protein L11 methyltransferase|uniref:50S ribosomal protein L11 methyltransferase n=1 Tax=Parasphingorhabdus sp. TaxID=2709688 RepID=UPI0039E357C8
MTETWKVSIPCTRAEAQTLAADNLFVSSADSTPTIVASELDVKRPDEWMIDVYCEQEPDPELVGNLLSLSPSAEHAGLLPIVTIVENEDWVTLSQQGLEPLRAGRFHVHTSSDQPSENPKLTNICIDAGQAFGTGHHETTMGCLQSLDQLRRSGHRFRNIADVGTGSGLLAFAAHHLWRDAKIIASDIDPIAVTVTESNAERNAIPLGNGRRHIRLVQSNGLDHPALRQRAPFDLIIANILAGPLVALAPQIATASTAGTVLLLAGLLSRQKAEVVSAYVREGFRLKHSRLDNEWPCLTLVKAKKYGWTRKPHRKKSPLASDYFGEC